MDNIRTLLIVLSAIALLTAVLASACGGSESEDQEWARQDGTLMASAPAAPAPAPTAAPARAREVTLEREVVKEVQVVGETVSVQAPAAPAPAAMAQKAASETALTGSDGSAQTQAQLVSQQRIIIRTVNMTIVVDEIQAAMDDISELAVSMGGWVVSSDRRQKHTGRVSVRVPAADLDSAIETLRGMASDVESEISTSEDVTDEYFDLRSRLKNQQATEAALIRLLDRAENVEHALAVQRELSNVQENVERIQGRIKLLEETSAYSLVTVNLRLAPVQMSVDAGADQSVAVHTPTRFRATFRPPEGVDGHEISWDFGDGSAPTTITRTAPTAEERERVTATVTHVYDDPKDSPFIVQVRISSFGESGIAEGEDTLIVSVSEIPVIEVFAGERDYRVVQNEVVEFSGSFTRPQGLSDVRYQWDFGDGSPPEEGELGEGITRVDTTHAYTDFRSTSYRVKFTVSADSAVGEITASHEIRALVEEDIGLIVGGFEVDDTAKSAVRTLSVVVSGLTTAIIWVGIFSPIWSIFVAVALFFGLRERKRGAERPRRQRLQPETEAEPYDGPQPS